MRRLRLLSIVLVALLSACSAPLPPERADYAGLWRAGDTTILITPTGRVEYVVRRGNGFSKSIKAPLQRFEGDSFVVGLGPMSTTFIVTQPPHRDQGVWKMTVDGVELVRSQ
ncbi:hypothetical protein DFR29_114153 [Tahibacter aquaticus]|uniref:Lipoprotein n=1 Tax=Tahibacter aquaticus TaxID=520092 RepID=A0A4R6YQB2_9GAMM|nr:hypothetical protein [Tahibacter aquaticus]TDR40101.1 hypothetical protein DFR29_114153 [Tahibacter aquaticus]